MIALWVQTIAQPDPVPQPGPGWLIVTLLLVTFVLHVLPMNFVLGGSIIAAVARLRGRAATRPHHAALTLWLARAMPVAVAAAVTFGVAPLLFLQVLYGRVFFSSSVLMAGFWLAVVPVLILAYYGTYLLAYKGAELGRTAVGVSWGVALGFLAIGLVYTSNMTLMLRPDRFAELDRAGGSGLYLNLADPTVAPRFLHMLLGAVAVAGLAVALHGWFVRRERAHFGTWAIRYGASWCAAATALNIVAGFWWVLALPSATLVHVMSQAPAVALFAGVTTGLVALALAVFASRAADPLPLLGWLVAGLLGTVVLMVVTRDQIRTHSLVEAGLTPATWVVPQWGPISLFVALLLAGVATVAWMVKALAEGGGDPGARQPRR